MFWNKIIYVNTIIEWHIAPLTMNVITKIVKGD